MTQVNTPSGLGWGADGGAGDRGAPTSIQVPVPNAPSKAAEHEQAIWPLLPVSPPRARTLRSAGTHPAQREKPGQVGACRDDPCPEGGFHDCRRALHVRACRLWPDPAGGSSLGCQCALWANMVRSRGGLAPLPGSQLAVALAHCLARQGILLPLRPLGRRGVRGRHLHLCNWGLAERGPRGSDHASTGSRYFAGAGMDVVTPGGPGSRSPVRGAETPFSKNESPQQLALPSSLSYSRGSSRPWGYKAELLGTPAAYRPTPPGPLASCPR